MDTINNTNNDINEVNLSGTVIEAPETIQVKNSTILKFPLEIPRLSGASDVIPVTVPADCIDFEILPGQYVSLTGKYRSHNNLSGVGPKLVLQVFTRKLKLEEELNPQNEILLSGTIFKDPILRKTLNGRDICDVFLDVRRNQYRADHIPVIAWGKIALAVNEMKPGDNLRLHGRIQSREYYKQLENDQTEVRVAYEVSMMRFVS